MSAAVENSEAAIFSRVISPDNANLSPDAANSILQISFPRTDLDRMNFLAGKARDGALTESEAGELENYRHVGRLIEVNPDPTPLSPVATQLIREPAGVALPRLVDELLATPPTT